MKKNSKKTSNGFTIVEALLAGVLLSFFVAALLGGVITAQESSARSGIRVKAQFLANEALEALRSVRDASFAGLVPGQYGLSTANPYALVSNTPDTSGGFTRTITLSSVDANTVRADVSVAWTRPLGGSESVSVATYLTNWHKIVSGFGNWSAPQTDGSVGFPGTQDGLKVVASGSYAYAIRQNTGSNLTIVDVSNPSSPSFVGTVNISGTPTNIAISGTLLFVSSDNNGQELQIFDIANPASPVARGAYNAPGNADGLAVFAVGSTVYLGRASSGDDEFFVIDASNPSSPALRGSLSLSGSVFDIAAVGTVVYAATTSDSQELVVISAATPTAPTVATSLNLSGNDDGISVSAAGDVLALGRAGAGNVHVFDISSPLSPSQTGSVATGDVVRDLFVFKDENNKMIFGVGDANANEFFTIDPGSPNVLFGFFDTANDLNGVFYDPNVDRAYTVGDDDTEFIVFKPQ